MKNFKAGYYQNQGYYKSFQPNFINKSWILNAPEIQSLLSQADRQLGRLDMFSNYVPNLDLFISMHILKEATQSNKIEGTQTKIEEALLERDEIPEEKRNDYDEVQNYIAAMNYAIDRLATLPFSSRLIKETHKILLKGVRGKHKTPGDFRKSQNWIGGATINDAVFVPPIHTSVLDYMSDIDKFANDELNKLPDLIKIALIHYQFETIHPFLDGNGRVGRLLITLYLVNKNILKRPILYLSDFFEKNRTNYYDNLTTVREKDNINQWIKFFLVGIIETAKKSINTFDQILQLQKEIDIKIQTLGSRSGNAQKMINILYQTPIISSMKATNLLKVSPTTSMKLLNDLENMNILREMTGMKRNKKYVFWEYLELFIDR